MDAVKDDMGQVRGSGFQGVDSSKVGVEVWVGGTGVTGQEKFH